ncbi:hypothetical protein M133_2799 [Bacteroides fragilis str. S24L26]|nr:hypothetical protein M133_2799 [Bacteroides fragilis str. S24L26]
MRNSFFQECKSIFQVLSSKPRKQYTCMLIRQYRPFGKTFFLFKI